MTDPQIFCGNKWTRRCYAGPVLKGCIFCEQTIARKTKYDYNITRKVFAHTTCGLVSLDTLPQESWVGRRVLHPMEQWGGVPNWKDEKYDQGVVAYWSSDDKYLCQEVYFRVDNSCGAPAWLHYRDYNLWVRP